ncbi:MAG TPA: T9SS type A sorting domain-containing protein [Bacteroidales bacterium]|nr:T9SS type A sorting domain-containing protein [Bacteroidales bacterium]HPT01226.1 T9SS type A sorting domain-containing protein [Bacteroidales bacterium]
MKQNNLIGIFLLQFLAFILPVSGYAQVEKGGMPRSFSLKGLSDETGIIEITPPDRDSLIAQDYRDALLDKGYRMGVVLPLEISMNNSGNWYSIQGGRIWKLCIRSAGAQALTLYYERFSLPEGADFFVYSKSGQHIAGAFTPDNNPEGNCFATRLIPGDEIVLEYYEPFSVSSVPVIELNGLLYAYRSAFYGSEKNGDDFGGSGSCEVNVNCSEGDNWKDQKQGVVRILTRIGNNSFWCTGSLLNNTSQDYSPLLITASHCALNEYAATFANSNDLMQWIFYFNYESEGCEDPVKEPVRQTMVGAEKLATSYSFDNDRLGSDFYLLRLTGTIPSGYNPFYNGWDCNDVPSSSGVCIHHPQGDIRKISTYTKPVVSSTWESIPGTHWETYWSETQNGYGVTEGGSSGSPLFNKSGQVIGILTGGGSYCNTPNLSDYFGKIAYSWVSNGTADTNQLKPWLDPVGTGIKKIAGSYNSTFPIARFNTDTITIPIGSSVTYYDLSVNNPTGWHWYFEGGIPSESYQKYPPAIVYNTYGTFDVKLTVTNEYGSDSLIKEDYLTVSARVFPNPTTGKVTLLLGPGEHPELIISVFNQTGQKILEYVPGNSTSSAMSIDLSGLPASVYFVSVRTGESVQVSRIVKI